MNKIEEFKKFLISNNIEFKIKEGDKLIIQESLYLGNTGIKELPEGLTVGGNLDLRNTGIKELPKRLTVGEYLDLSNTGIKELPEGLTVGGSLYLSNTGIKELPEGLTVGGNLYLRNTGIKELPEGLTVGGSLYLSNTGIKELPEGLTVGEDLDLRNTGIKELPEDLMVEGNIYFSNIVKQGKRLKKGYNRERNYIYFDNILWGNVKSIKKIENKIIYKTPLGYCIVEKETSAHGKNLREALEDLIYKETQKEDKEKIVAEIKKTGKVNRAQYRAITGACKYGTNKFCEEHNIQDLEEISLEELRKILINDYGAEEFWSFIKGE